jgi:hydrogenase nickel incorporation protein HypA/HybF
MHEFALAQSMFEIACRQARGQRVTKVEVHVGHLRQVVPASRSFAFELTAHGTELEGVELEIVQVPATGVCRDCGTHLELPDFPQLCPACGGLDVDITSGEELQIESLEIAEPYAAAPSKNSASASPSGVAGGSP